MVRKRRSETEKATIDLAASAVATGGALALGADPLAATAVGASAPALALVHSLMVRAVERRHDRSAWAFAKAAELLDCGIDILAERTLEHEIRHELVARVLEAAERSPIEEKLGALSRVLADGLQDDSALGDSLVLAAALDDLEAPHIAVLNHLATHPVPHKSLWSSEFSPSGWEVDHVKATLPQVEQIADGVMAVLNGHGLIRSPKPGTWEAIESEPRYVVTALGRKCLFLLGHRSST